MVRIQNMRSKIDENQFFKICPRTSSDRHDQTETDAVLWVFLLVNRMFCCGVFDRGWRFWKICPQTLSDRRDQTETDRALWVFLLDHNGQTQLYRLVSGQSDAWLWRNFDFPTEDDDLKKCALEVCLLEPIQKKKNTRLGLQCWNPLRSYALTLDPCVMFWTSLQAHNEA